MRIGVITYWNSNDNYGQILQCYALQKCLRDKGHDAFLIRYLPRSQSLTLGQKIRKHLSPQGIAYLLSKQHKTDKCTYHEEERLRLINLDLNKKRDFEDFRQKHIHSTEIVYRDLRELRNNQPKADIYICGSDQVWNNPLELPETAAWYLAFGNAETRRVAYAASIGRDLNQHELPLFKKYLAAFEKIGVREESTRLLCERLNIKNVQVTLDPTLLLPVEEYRKIASFQSNTGKPYLFMYVLNVSTSSEIHWEKIREYIEREELDFKIVCSSGYMQARELLEGYRNLQATVPEWLWCIDNARCVITTSFHGVVFCIKMHKPFLAILLTNKYSKGNDRITSLLNTLGLSERIYRPALSVEEQLGKPIYWKDVEHKINELQKQSRNFLDSL